MEMDGVLAAIFDPATSSLRTSNGGRPTPAEQADENLAWGAAFDAATGTLRVVAVA